MAENNDESEMRVQLQSYNLVGIKETWMKCCHEGMQTFQEGQDGQMMRRSCPSRDRAVRVHRALSRDG